MNKKEYIERDYVLRSLTADHHPWSAYEDSYEIVQNAPAADVVPRREWISVKDRLPEKDGKYLCVCHTTIHLLSFALNLKKVNKYAFPGKARCGWYDSDPEWGYYEMDTVTHWMPLPETPHMRKEDEVE